ncbi:hypothetical protein AXF42_Ash007697 [Apostasia shenzhenica]|uniref:Uncharacterized protein n=1 Tax=Apostasia shenzhenica TaxID=1088818 RepID=A0A2I0A669_9ASPA|nr:hypothetical protein AXF42_Ash007697 [Apostasia shenzhenica]
MHKAKEKETKKKSKRHSLLAATTADQLPSTAADEAAHYRRRWTPACRSTTQLPEKGLSRPPCYLSWHVASHQAPPPLSSLKVLKSMQR